MSKLSWISVTAGALALAYLLAVHSIPAIQAHYFVKDCQETGWITDSCVESSYFQEQSK